MIEKLSTGIDNLDDKMNGGIPVGSITLLSGESGTGKTTFALQWLAEGNDPAYLFTFLPKELVEEHKNSLGIKKDIKILSLGLKDARSFFLDLPEEIALDENCKIAIDSVTELIDHRISSTLEEGVGDQYYKELKEIGFLKKQLLDSKKDTGQDKFMHLELKQLFIELETGLKSIKRSILDAQYTACMTTAVMTEVGIRNLLSGLRMLDCTFLLIAESPFGSNKISKDGIIDFLVDNVIILTSENIAGEPHYLMKIHKMRMCDHEREFFEYKLTEKGIKIE